MPSSDRGEVTNKAPVGPSSRLGEQSRTVVRNGYSYGIDPLNRTRRVAGNLTVAEVPVRSRTSQAKAGGADRRPGDDGGHYIAARFNGPTEAFNHFAQDANFNRGTFRLLEEEWAREKRAGKVVTVTIVPYYDGASLRSLSLDIWWTVDGVTKSIKMRNERGGKASD